MKVSVIVPTYKPQTYLWECLNSIYNQTFPKSDYELVLVLNGCKKPYNNQILEWLSKHKSMKVQFFQTDAGGVSNARNIALDNANGQYVTFIDDDDFISPSYLKELYDNASVDTISLCYPLSFIDGTTDYKEYYITQDYNRNAGQKVVAYQKAKKFFSGPVYKLIHRDIIGGRRFDCRFKNGEDSIYMFLISDRFKMVSFTSRNAVYYRRIRSGSASVHKKPIVTVVKNQMNMIIAYSSIYIQRPLSYKFPFFLTRILGALHSMVERLASTK